MENKIKKYSIISFIFTAVIGTLFHFAFEFSGGNTLVGAFTSVNESVWEHLKLLLFPAIIISFVEYFAYGKYIKNFFTAKVASILIGMLLIIVLFYTYSGIIGNDYAVIDVLIFYISVAIYSYLSYRLIKNGTFGNSDRATIVSMLIIAVVIVLFIYFTFNTPMLEIFRDPLTEDFGIVSRLIIRQ